MSILKAAAASKTARMTAVMGLAAAAVVASATSSSAAAAALTVTSPTGATTGATLSLTAAANTFKTASGTLLVKNTSGTLAANAIQLNTATCPASPATTGTGPTAWVYNAATATVVSGSKIVITTGAVAAKAYNVCVYNNAGTSAVLAAGKYTAYAPPTITGISVSSGPVFGGGTVTVDGTNFTAKTTAKLGTADLTNVKVNTAGTSFTATVPANSAGAKNLVVTTEGGPATSTNAYTYRNGLSVSPSTMVGNTKQVVDVTGYAFTDTAVYDFTGAAKVYLVRGDYNPTSNSGVKTLGETATCGSVVVVSDTNLICTLDGTSAAIADGAYTVVAVNDGAVGAQANVGYTETIINSLATFTVAPY